MDYSTIIKQQKKGVNLHRIIYLIFAIVRFFTQVEKPDTNFWNTVSILVFLAACLLFEEIFYRFDYFKSGFLVKVFRYSQCVLSIAMLCFMNQNDVSNLSIFSLLIMFMVDFFLAMNVIDRQGLATYMAYVAVPVAVVLLFRLISYDLNEWIIVVFDISMVLMIVFYEACALVNFVDVIERKLFMQQNEIEEMIKQNQKIVNIQNKLQDTNYVLNTQKNDLKNANKKIREANAEMAAQAEVLQCIASSFDVPMISDQITDVIMNVKELEFCAVHIKKNVYRNKNSNTVIKAYDDKLRTTLAENIENIYNEMVDEGQNEVILHEDVKVKYPFLKDFGLKKVYFKVLRLNEDSYGLFVIGDKSTMVYDEKMSFYDAIIAQFDIAIGNAKVYSDMQHMAQKDGLTGINNRIHFNNLFKNESQRVVDEKSCVSVALFDIDKFKSVNDTYGHLAGDEVIKRIASVTEECIDRHDGFICRYGGEEFVVVLPDRDLEAATPIIQELFEELCKQVVHFNEFDIHISVSVGLTAYPEVCQNTDELLKRSDWCMYYAKEHGRHQIKVDDGSIQRD